MLANTEKKAEKVLKAVSGCPRLVFDVETSGLDWKRNTAVGYVLTFGPNANQTWYVPIRHRGGGNLSGSAPLSNPEDWQEGSFHPFEVKLAEILESRGKEFNVIGHFIKFDMHMAMNQGIDLTKNRVECTMVNAALIDENIGRYSLEVCAERMGCSSKLGDELYNHMANKFGGELGRKQMANFWRLAGDDKLAEKYASNDGTVTWNLWERQQKMLDAEDLRTVWSVERRVTRTLFRMERRGVKVDEKRLAQINKEIENRIKKADKALPDGFNPRSPKHVREYIENSGHTDWPTTEKGNPSFPEKWLVTFEAGRHIVNKRKLTNIINSFIMPLQTRHLWVGRVHPTFNQTKSDDYGTVTGRLSSSDPNMQQVPKRDEGDLAKLFRQVFISDKDMVWSANDYEQQELVIMAEYTGAAVLVKGYNSDPPIDAHTVVAEMLGVERDPTAKRMNLGLGYGMGYKTLAGNLGVSESVSKKYVTAYNKRMPELKQFMKFAEGRAKVRGWVKTKLGRRRRFPNKSFAHKAGNSIIQGTSADITKLKMVEIDEFFEMQGDVCHMLLQVHDELDWQYSPKFKGQDRIAKEIMTNFGKDAIINLVKVPLIIESKTGPNWSVATFGPDQPRATHHKRKAVKSGK